MGISRIRRSLYGGLLLVAILLAFAGPVWPEEPPGEIRIITPRWEGQTNADGSGLFFDILRAVYGPDGIRLAYTFAPWKRCRAMVNSGREDAMLCVWKAHAREQHQLTTYTPLYIEHTVAVVKKASGIVWKGIHSLDYRRVVWLRGYHYDQSPGMRGIQIADWYEVNTHEEAWHLLALDRFDAYMDARIDIEVHLKSNPDTSELYQVYPLWKQKAYVAFSDTTKSRALIRIYNTRAKDLLTSGRLAAIHKKWNQPFDPADWTD